MPPTVRAVADLPGLQLRRLAGPDGADRLVRWVAVSELEDPRAFLEGGELLLTTGMRLPEDDDEALASYVDRVAEAGVSALGLAVGMTHATCPPALARAADAHGLPLLEVPVQTPFIAISKAVSALLGAEEYESISRAVAAQRDLTRAALGGAGGESGPAAVAVRLARYVGGWVLVLDADGAVLHAAPAASGATSAADATADRASRLGEEVQVLRSRGLLASSSLSASSGRVALHPLGARGTVRGFLAVGTADPLDRPAQSVVAVAVSLLSLAVEQDVPREAGGAGVAAAALRLLVAGAEPTHLPLELLGWDWLPAAELRLLIVQGSEGAAAAVAGLAARLAPRSAVAALDGEPLLLVRDDPALLDEVQSTLVGAGLLVGGSGPCSIASLPVAGEQARHALAAAHALSAGGGGGLRWFGQLASAGMLAALDPEAARAVADALLAPLDGRKGDLVRSLSAWLARHGQWDLAAGDLGVHRHTLRYRMRRVEELLERSLDDPDLRAELWLALRVHGAG